MRFSTFVTSTCSRAVLVILLIFVITTSPAHAGWLDWLSPSQTNAASTAPTAATPPAVSNPPPAAPAIPALTTMDITSGLRDALARGTEKAIANLGKPDGFLKNAAVKIPLPSSLAEIEKGLRLVGKEKYADDFVVSMNRAAEAAVTNVGSIFSDAIKNMTVADAEQILNGPDDAATQYFRKVSTTHVKELMKPIVKEATDAVGATAAYKNLMKNAAFLGTYMNQSQFDLDQYVTDKAADGLFKMIAEQEKEIRKNPLARTDDLLKKVFGAAAK